MSSLFCNISNTLFDQKSTALSVPVADGGDIQTEDKHTNIVTNRQNCPRGQFSYFILFFLQLDLSNLESKEFPVYSP